MSEFTQHEIDVATPIAYSGSAAAVLIGELSVHEWASIVGIFCAVVTVGINWYYKHKNLNLNIRQKKRRKKAD